MSAAAPEPTGVPDDPGAARLRILVVDADDRTRESVVGLLGIKHRFDVVGSAGHIADAVALTKERRPDVVILDPRLPEVIDGLSLIHRMRTIHPAVRVCVVGWSPDLEHEALASGADVFVRKTFKPGDLAAAIARCTDGDAGCCDTPDTRPSESSFTPVPARGTGVIL